MPDLAKTRCRRQAWFATRNSDPRLPLADLDPGSSLQSIPFVLGIPRDLLVCCHWKVTAHSHHVRGIEEQAPPGTITWRGPSSCDRTPRHASVPRLDTDIFFATLVSPASYPHQAVPQLWIASEYASASTVCLALDHHTIPAR